MDLRLLVDADHHGLLGRVHVQTDDVADLGVEFGVGGELEGLGSPRLQVPLAPDPGHRGEGDLQLRGQQPGRPVRHPEVRGWTAVGGEGGHHDVDLVDLGWPTAARLIMQRPDPARDVPGAPVDHRRPAGPGPTGDLGVGQSLSSEQHDPCPRRQARSDRTRPSQGLQPRTIALTQDQRCRNRHDSLSRTTDR